MLVRTAASRRITDPQATPAQLLSPPVASACPQDQEGIPYDPTINATHRRAATYAVCQLRAALTTALPGAPIYWDVDQGGCRRMVWYGGVWPVLGLCRHSVSIGRLVLVRSLSGLHPATIVSLSLIHI